MKISCSLIEISLLRHGGKCDKKACTASLCGFGTNLAVVGINDGAADRQADAHAFGFRANEGHEKLACDLGVEPRSAIGYAELYHTLLGLAAGDHEFTLLDRLHGLDGIAHEVENDLLKLCRVGENRRQILAQGDLYLNILLARSNQGQGEGFLDHGIEVVGLQLTLAAANELAQTPNDLPGSFSLLHRPGHQFRDAPRPLVLERSYQPEAGIHVVRDGGHGLIQFMGYGRRHFAQFADASDTIE